MKHCLELQKSAMNRDQRQKYERLQAILRDTGGVVLGYSGGVDSTLLAKTAYDVLGDRAVIVTSISELLAEEELDNCRKIAAELGFQFRTIKTNELDLPEFRANSPLRCAFCKSELMEHLRAIAQEEGIETIALGVNVDDLGDYRPGQAAAKEKGARFPLLEAGMTKEDIRAISKALNLPTWNKPALACLASRFPYGEEITAEKLTRVADAERILNQAGFQQYRVRYHKDVARIEVPPQDMPRLLERRDEIVPQFKELGFIYTAMDLAGFRSGSMNETLHSKPVTAAPAPVSETPRTEKPARSAKIDPAKTYTIYCDGGSRGNPGPAGYGAVIYNDSGEEVIRISQSIGKATNNVAEYHGLIAALSKARDMGIRRVVVKLDSELIVRQITGVYRVKQEHLKPLHAKCLTILRTLDRWRIQHVPRAENAVADRLANEAIDTDA